MWEVMMVSGTILGFTRKTGEGTILCMRAVRCYDFSASLDECMENRWNCTDRWGDLEKYSEKNRPAATSSAIILTITGLGSDPIHRTGRPATNHPSHGKVFMAHIMDLWCVALCGSVGWSQCIQKMEAAVSFDKMATVHEGTRPGTPEHVLANVTIWTRVSADFFADWAICHDSVWHT
jgi:hypothetical protein